MATELDTARGAPPPDGPSKLRGSEGREELGGMDAVKAAATPKGAERMTPAERASALAWFLEDDEVGEVPTHSFSLVVSGPDEPERKVNWTIRALDMDTIDAIRQRARGGNRRQRRAGEAADIDEMKAAIGMVVAATIDPDLEQARAAKGAVSADDVLRHRFRHKPGLILQVSGKVLELSGYDEGDIGEAVAAKNS